MLLAMLFCEWKIRSSAMQSLAAQAREMWGGDVVAVTGSAGKTTTKDVIAEMLAVGIKTTKSEGNLNNHVGLPLSLLRLDETARVMVTEIGMNHAGEIRELAEIAQPNVGVVTNVGHAHIEFFEDIEGIAAAKRELIESLGDTGTAVLNADDPRVAAFAEAHRGRTIFFGQSRKADVRAEDVEVHARKHALLHRRYKVFYNAYRTSQRLEHPGGHRGGGTVRHRAEPASGCGREPSARKNARRTL